IVGQRGFKEASCRRCDYHVLLAVLAQISNRSSVSRGTEFHRPQFLSCSSVEGSKAAVVGGADEDQVACGGNGPAAAWPTRVPLIRWQSVRDPQIHAPRELAGVHIDGGQHTPWRLLEHHIGLGIFESSSTGNGFVRITAVTSAAGLRSSSLSEA